jgi:hypothetical protein
MTLGDTNLSTGDKGGERRPAHVGFLLIPDFALLAYASAVEPLRAANRLSGRDLYRWSHVSIDGEPATASNGVSIRADHAVGAEARFDYVIVCAGGNPAVFHHPQTFAWLRQMARHGVRLGGVSGGPTSSRGRTSWRAIASRSTGSMRRLSWKIIQTSICGAHSTRLTAIG